MDYQALKVVYHYVCRGAILKDIAESGEHGSRYNTRAEVTECVNSYGFDTAKEKGGYGNTGKSCGIFPNMSFEEFCEHMQGYRGKDGDDFRKKVAQDNTLGQSVYQQPQSVQQAQFPQQSMQQPTFAPSMPDGGEKSGVPGKRAASIGGAILFAVIIFAVFIFPRIGELSGGGPLNSKNAVNEIQNFTPTLLSGLTIGEMFNGACADGVWSTYESNKMTWVRFTGTSGRGAIQATFTLNKDKLLDYTCYIGGSPAPLDELYRMFHDPNYDKEMDASAADAQNDAKFDEAEARIQIMAFVHDYVVADLGDMTILEFVDSVCTGGDWSVNDRTANLRVAFDGMSDSGAVQAMFDVDRDAGTVIATWYLSSKEIEAADLYRTFYQSE